MPRRKLRPTNIFREVAFPATEYSAHFNQDKEQNQNHLNKRKTSVDVSPQLFQI
jgi:hypothetical protein